MNKRTLIIIISIVAVLALSVGGIYVYKKNLIPFGKKPVAEVLTPESLLSSFVIKNPNLTAEQAQLFQQRFDEAKKNLQTTPDDFNSWLYVGVLKKGVGDYEGARDIFIYAGQIRPQSSTPFGNLADLYANFLNEPQKGLQAIKTAIANDPNDYNFYLTMAEIYRYRLPGQESMYETVMLDAMQKFPDNPNLVGPLALYYKQTNQVKKAIVQYEKLVILSPENQAAKEDLAELKQK